MGNDFINDFIEEYKNQPCLWQASSADFKDRRKRQEAYYKLIEVANKHGEHYNIERTKQKINNLRCAFRHQLKKINENKNNKSGREEGYCPKRRYVERLMFLLNEEQLENAKVDNLKTTPITKKKTNGASKNHNNLTSSKKNTSCEKSQVICEAIVIPGDPAEETNKEKQNKDMTVKSIDNPTEPIKDSQNSMHIEVHCDENVNLLWPRPSITQKTSEPCVSESLTITTAPSISSTAPPVVPVSISIPLMSSVPIPSITTNPSNSIVEVNNTRLRRMSTSSQNSSYSISENASKKIKVDCSATNFDKLLSLACSKINYHAEAEDDFTIFGKMVSYKLKSMDPQQAIIAEKMITDILLEGQMKMLSYPLRTTFRQEEQAYVINLNGNPGDQQQGDKYSSQNIQYSTGSGS